MADAVKKRKACAADPAWLTAKLAALPMAWIEARVVEDAHGCWLWTGQECRGRLTVMLTSGRRQQKTLDARRLVYRLVYGQSASRSMSPRCTHNGRCVHPDHLALQPMSPRHESVALWRAAISRARQRGSLVMNHEKARQIRNSHEPLRVLAQRFGCSVSLASLIRRGLAWPEPASPFSALLLGMPRGAAR